MEVVLAGSSKSCGHVCGEWSLSLLHWHRTWLSLVALTWDFSNEELLLRWPRREYLSYVFVFLLNVATHACMHI